MFDPGRNLGRDRSRRGTPTITATTPMDRRHEMNEKMNGQTRFSNGRCLLSLSLLLGGTGLPAGATLKNKDPRLEGGGRPAAQHCWESGSMIRTYAYTYVRKWTDPWIIGITLVSIHYTTRVLVLQDYVPTFQMSDDWAIGIRIVIVVPTLFRVGMVHCHAIPKKKLLTTTMRRPQQRCAALVFLPSPSMLRLGWEDFFNAVLILITAFGAAAAIHSVLKAVSCKTRVVTVHRT